MNELDDDAGTAALDEPAERRLCAYTGCRAPLPVMSGPGNRARYCQDGRTWGPKNVSCKQAGHAEELLASVGREQVSAATTTELAEHVRTALGPTRQLAGTLEQVQGQLESDVADALRERDAAVRAATEERGWRLAAEEHVREADQRANDSAASAHEAIQEREGAVADRDEARRAEQESERAQLRAETQEVETRQRAERAEARLLEATERTERAEQALVARTSELTALRTRLDEESSRWQGELQRAEQALTQVRAEHSAALDQLRSAHAAEVTRLREEHEHHRQSEVDRQGRVVAELHRQLGSRDQQLADATARCEDSRAQVERCRSAVAALAEHPEEVVVESALAELDAILRDAPLQGGHDER